MSDSDSFINEVTEEVQRDKLFAFFRKWGWAFGLGVLLIVGAGGYAEFRRNQNITAAQDFGDAIVAAALLEDPAEVITALEAIEAEGPGAEMLLALTIANQESLDGRNEDGAARLRAIAAQADLPDRYRDLALLKAQILHPEGTAEARVTLDRLAQPGAPYRPLAIEQLAYLEIAEGDPEAAIALLEELLGEAGTTQALQQRVRQLIVALQSGATLVDEPLPEPDLPEEEPAALPDFPVGEAVDEGEEDADGAAPSDGDADAE